MSFVDRIDPGLRAAFDARPDRAAVIDDIVRVRQLAEQARLAAPPPPIPDDVIIEDRRTTSSDGERLWIRMYLPADRPDSTGALYYMHGGGMVLFNPLLGDAFCAAAASRLKIVVASVDYRLAPEHPYPTPLDDCHSGLEWFFAEAGNLGVDAARIAIGGASAGGGLAAGLALLARDRGTSAPCFQLLTYPMIDDRQTTASSQFVTDTRIWNRGSNAVGWDAYLAGRAGADDIDHYAAPARAGDLSGLPPAIITVGDLDLFLDENIAYAQALLAAGVPTELHVYSGAYHGCQSASPDAPIVKRWRRDEFDALERALNPDMNVAINSA